MEHVAFHGMGNHENEFSAAYLCGFGADFSILEMCITHICMMSYRITV